MDDRRNGTPWYVLLSVLAVTSAIVGVHWDISWHRSIGRDAFWTPAHVAIYLCGVLAGVVSAYLILSTTFNANSPLRESSVSMWGFRAPVGAFVMAWGGIAMLVSAPFDNWWHEAYGLDVKIISPPHALLFLGNGAIQLGALILILGRMNRSAGKQQRVLDWLFLYASSMLALGAGIFLMAYSFPNQMHSGLSYRVACTTFPFLLAGFGAASRQRWASTKLAGMYMLFCLAALWILPLFPAEPKLGPVYHKVTHFIPAPFPLLLIVPAFFLDLVRQEMKGRDVWLQAFAAGSAFLASFLAVQWPFADFMLSPAARNWFFGAHYIDFLTRPTSPIARYQFLDMDRGDFWTNLALALFFAILTTRLGIGWGESMRRVRR
ncbi:MAG TPA: hypothetical protein VL285_20730 [Bryobacteraceae bacterium]|nr:hypothetical protein [Bryobacteraceae bacterium]